jgi:hypothetical protein
MKTFINVWRMLQFAACPLETAHFITSCDICTRDLWLVPDFVIHSDGLAFTAHYNFTQRKYNTPCDSFNLGLN